jgi:phage major head subunit gpT-like protein
MADLRSLSSRAILGYYYAKLAEYSMKSWASLIMMNIPTDQEIEEFKFLGQVPTFREWVGGRQAKGLRENGFTIKQKVFEMTLEVDVNDVRRDKTGQYAVRIAEMARRAAYHDASLASGLLNNAAGSVCYDGQFFFDTDHQEGNSPVQSNLLSLSIATMPGIPAGTAGAPTNPSGQVMADAIFAGSNRITTFTDDQGEPMNEDAQQFLIMVPSGLEKAALTAVSAQTFATNQDNLLKNTPKQYKVVANPRLTQQDRFNIFRTDGEMKPLIFAEELKTEMKAIAEGSELEFKEDKHQYGAKRICNVGLGDWHYACQVILTA